MDFSQFIDKVIELANTPGGFLAVLVVCVPVALWALGSYSKRMAEARRLEAETKKIRAQGDAETDVASAKNTTKILDIMQKLADNDTEKNRMFQAEFDKRREDSEQSRRLMEKVSDALTEFTNENKATRFDNRASAAVLDGSMTGLMAKIDGMSGEIGTLKDESADSHTWVRATVTEMYEKITVMHTQIGVMYKLVMRPDKPPTPPTEPASATPEKPAPLSIADATQGPKVDAA